MKSSILKVLYYFLLALLVVNVCYVASGAVHFPLAHVDVWAN